MSGLKRAWDILSDEQRQVALDDIIAFFYEKRDEKIGVIAANEILDFFLQSGGKYCYKKGVDDAKKILKQRYEDLEVDLDLLWNAK
ncbi:MAG: hypothetical protein COV59_02705 [Candidatus Magasanikbacteria bacterium CG11_big_fil_rev_8_21_14_0_20_39_34]|uniref:DUF2164 domain-containing protein n=1 Tax=Candidatus Magasanikbacteria bacterium CG11_big_fil_rev_8_21_14_0_20_39_34 TaxID=1974653 RepID=A0A2H0N584_9BACT|nr:MAG: hypothetical protein COV59_02705 [Candidatus Magasanikbacteria bacterium CG11_big_fil_rev_8_21_14_0_20_39_34]